MGTEQGGLCEINSNLKAMTLLPLASKVLCGIVINRLQCGVDHTIRKKHAGLRRERATGKQIFILSNILEQASERNAPVYIHFVDFRLGAQRHLLVIMKKYEIHVPKKLIKMVNTLYDDFCD